MKKSKQYMIAFLIFFLAIPLIWLEYEENYGNFIDPIPLIPPIPPIPPIPHINYYSKTGNKHDNFQNHNYDSPQSDAKKTNEMYVENIITQKDYTDLNNNVFRLLNYTKTIERIEVCIILNLFSEALEHLDELKKLDFFASKLNEIDDFESEIQNLKQFVPTMIFPSENLLYQWIGSFLKIQSIHKNQLKISKKKLLKDYQLFKAKFYEKENITKIMGTK